MRPFFLVVVIGVIDDLGFVGKRRVARPYPQDFVAFHHGERLNMRLGGDVLLAGNVDTIARRIEGQPVIAALQALLDHVTVGQRRPAMAAPVFQRAHFAVGVPKDHHRLVHNRPREQPVIELFGPGSNVPGVPHEWLIGFPCHRSTPK